MKADKEKMERIAAIIAEPAQPDKTCLSVAVRLLGSLIEHKPVGAESGVVEKVLVELADYVNIAATQRGISDRKWVELMDPFLAVLPAGSYKAYYTVKAARDEMAVIYAAGVYNTAVGAKQKGTAE